MEFDAVRLVGRSIKVYYRQIDSMALNCGLTHRPACASRLKSRLWLCDESSRGSTPGFGNHKKACYPFSLLANMAGTPHVT